MTKQDTARWSREDKRGTTRNVEEKEMFRESSIPHVPPRPLEEIRQAAAWFAWGALEHDPDPDALEEILAMLGLDRDGVEFAQEREEPCWPYGGTSRGLNIHFKSYTHPCGPCTMVREERRAQPARRLGITHEGTIA